MKQWKRSDCKDSNSSSRNQLKENFPRLLKETIDAIGLCNTKNVKSGFCVCGIFPFDPNVVLKKMSGATDVSSSDSSNSSAASLSESAFYTELVLMLFKERFTGHKPTNAGRRKKVQISPGKSVLCIPFNVAADRHTSTPSKVRPIFPSLSDDSLDESDIVSCISALEEEEDNINDFGRSESYENGHDYNDGKLNDIVENSPIATSVNEVSPPTSSS